MAVAQVRLLARAVEDHASLRPGVAYSTEGNVQARRRDPEHTGVLYEQVWLRFVGSGGVTGARCGRGRRAPSISVQIPLHLARAQRAAEHAGGPAAVEGIGGAQRRAFPAGTAGTAVPRAVAAHHV